MINLIGFERDINDKRTQIVIVISVRQIVIMIPTIEQALLSCNPDKFASICRLYLGYRYPIVNPTGLVVGKEKSKKGTPLRYVSYDKLCECL